MYKLYFKTLFLLTTLFVFYMAITSHDISFIDNPYEDKMKHFMAFFTLSLLLNRSSSRYDARIRNVTALLLFGIFIEIVQSFLPYRDASVYDVIADLGGILSFQAALSSFRYLRDLLTPRPVV
ncbi:MAG: antibiotic resistance protein VanZ [Sulfurospirillum sp.]|nr:MAG: antibiotic resistance protein VanZ [Sulfurospirillum sp.]